MTEEAIQVIQRAIESVLGAGWGKVEITIQNHQIIDVIPMPRIRIKDMKSE